MSERMSPKRREMQNGSSLSGWVLECPDVDGIDELRTACGRAVPHRGYFSMESLGRKRILAVLLLVASRGLVLVGDGVAAGYGGGDGTLLGVMSPGTRCDSVRQVIVKL